MSSYGQDQDIAESIIIALQYNALHLYTIASPPLNHHRITQINSHGKEAEKKTDKGIVLDSDRGNMILAWI